nr:hypothetical protein [Pedobacter sp. ASV19]
MERTLPEYELYGKKFLVDVEMLELRQKDNEEYTISFLAMEDHGTHYRIDYNINDAFNVDIPPLKVLDPEGMSAKYGCSIDEMKDKTDFEIMVDQQALHNRLLGALPQIDLYGDTFYVDWRLKELRAKDDFAAVPLNLKAMEMNSDGTAYICLYHIPTKSEYQLDVAATKLPKDVVFLEIPYELKLDPVGVAREHGLKDTTFLRRFPIQKELKARVTLLSQTALPKIIENNRKKLQQAELPRKGRKIR